MMEILNGPNRTLWYSYDTGPNANAQILPITRKYTREHHDLIPYIRSLVYGSTQTGMPAMRMMPLAFPDDTAVADMFDEYTLGDAILVAPVLTAGATNRSVYLPRGIWNRLQRWKDPLYGTNDHHGPGTARRASALRARRLESFRGGHPAVEQQLGGPTGRQSLESSSTPWTGSQSRFDYLHWNSPSCR
jgi:hypothetical protein